MILFFQILIHCKAHQAQVSILAVFITSKIFLGVISLIFTYANFFFLHFFNRNSYSFAILHSSQDSSRTQIIVKHPEEVEEENGLQIRSNPGSSGLSPDNLWRICRRVLRKTAGQKRQRYFNSRIKGMKIYQIGDFSIPNLVILFIDIKQTIFREIKIPLKKVLKNQGRPDTSNL